MGRQWPRRRGEGPGLLSLYHQLHQGTVIGLRDKIGHVYRTELLGKGRGIHGPEAEHHLAADIAKDSLEHLALGLHDMLMGQGQAQPILAGLGEHPRESRGRKGMELIDMDHEGATLCLREIMA